MPRRNRFQHQRYAAPQDDGAVRYVRPPLPPAVGSPEFHQRMRRVAEAFRGAKVAAIYLVHGTFVGADSLGLLRDLARFSPSMAEPLLALHKQLVETMLDDTGNFTRNYAQQFEDWLNAGWTDFIPVRLFRWSSENHHLGRAEGAVQLLHELAQHQFAADQRVLLWGHSHGGNVFALATNLLGADSGAVESFFRAARCYYGRGWLNRREQPSWEAVYQGLRDGGGNWHPRQLDMVTMGTPVRYGWDLDGCGGLMHVVHHRPVEGKPQCQPRFPPTLDDIRLAAGGDLIQLLGVAGTNLSPPWWAWRAWLADIRLNRLVQRGVRSRDLLRFWQRCPRLHQDGTTLLVDYEPSGEHVAQHWAGHSVYTRLRWLLFHAEETAGQFYHSQVQRQHAEA